MTSHSHAPRRRWWSFAIPGVYIAWTFAAIHLLVTDRYLEFLHPRLLPLMLISTIGLLVFACISLSYRGQSHHGVTASELIARAGVLCVPLAMLAVLPPGGLGSHALSQAANAGAVAKDLAPSLAPADLKTDGPPPELTLLQVAAFREKLAGREVQTVGMVNVAEKGDADNGEAAGGVRLFRFIIVCCAADRRPIAVKIAFADSIRAGKKLQNDQWVRVRGTVSDEPPSPGAAATLIATEITPINPPPLDKRFLQAR